MVAPVDDTIPMDKLKRLFRDFETFCRVFWSIRDKAGKLVSFVPNRPQRIVLAAVKAQLDSGVPIRVLVLKYRQAGISTLVRLFALWWTLTHPGAWSVSIANRKDLPRKWIQGGKLLIEQICAKMRPEYHPKVRTGNELELTFHGLDSGYYIGSSEGRTPGMGDTLHGVHFSEKPYWRGADETVGELIPAVPYAPGTWIIQESTGLAVGDEWYRDYYAAKRGETHYKAVFLPWYLDEGYTISDVTWDSLCVLDDRELGIIADAAVYSRTPEAKMVGFEGVEPGQLAWRRTILTSEFHGDQNWFANKYPSNEKEAFLAGGLNVFQSQEIEIAHRTVTAQGAPKRTIDIRTPSGGDPTLYELVDAPAGYCSLWHEPDVMLDGKKVPHGHYHYVIGADCMWSEKDTDESDYDVAYVECLEDNRICAKVKGRFDLTQWGRILMALGYYYNTAWLAPERNGLASTVLMPMLLGVVNRDWRYPNVWIRNDDVTLANAQPQDYGWLTTAGIKSTASGSMVSFAIEETLANRFVWPDKECVEQMESWIKDDSLRLTHPEGMHDDDLMARMITGYVAHKMRQRITLWSPEQKPIVRGSTAWLERREEEMERSKARRYG